MSRVSASVLRAGVALVSVVFVGVSGPAIAAPTSPTTAPASPPKTVTWYANNRQERARVQLACIDDPGRLMSAPDCINAHQASVTAALRQARLHTGELDARKPAFWPDDPASRRNKLIVCRRNPGLANCNAARRSLLIEAGRG